MVESVRKIYHIGRSVDDTITEGGVSRDIAFSRALQSRVIRIKVTKGRIKNLCTIFWFLIFLPKASAVIMHYPNIGLPISDRMILGKFIRRFYAHLVERLGRSNLLCVDVADVPCDQALDLELPIPHHYADIEFRVFNAASVLMPASTSMQQLIVSKYPELKNKTYIVCNNGAEQYSSVADPLRFPAPESKHLNFVYAGTLNKGRSIETLLEIFSGGEHKLHLLGSGGGWIAERIKNKPNISYLGEMSEKEAFNFVTKCDVGLIPYDKQRPYYNVAYPTKLSFYAVAGVPYLCTPVAEALSVQEQYECGWILPIEAWREFIEALTFKQVASKKNTVFEVGESFTWASTLEPFFKYLESGKWL